MKQMDFTKLARSSDPQTSKDAAGMNARARDTHRHQLLMAYWSNYAMTDEEAGEFTGVHQAWKRCSELRKMGYIEATGKTKITKSGGRARVCRITDSGLAYASKLL